MVLDTLLFYFFGLVIVAGVIGWILRGPTYVVGGKGYGIL